MSRIPVMASIAKNTSASRGGGDPGLVEMYRRMMLIRCANGNIAGAGLRKCGVTPATCHAGDEAVTAGAISALADSDYLVSSRLSCGNAALAATDFAALAVRLGGRRRAAQGARAPEIVADALALAAQLRERGENAAVCSIFGDAVLSEAAFTNHLDSAAQGRLPVVLVCENNFCGFGTQFDGPDCQEALFAFAHAHGVPAERVDGGEVLEVYRAASAALDRARSGGGPALVDAVTYRMRNEAGFDRADALALHHPAFWSQRDPVRIARATILAGQKFSAGQLDELDREIGREVAAALRHAGTAGYETARVARAGE